MTHSDSSLVPAVVMDDDLGIVYLIETAQQFWSELEDVLKLPSNEYQTLTLLDAALRRFLSLCAAYHEQYLQSPLQLEHAFKMLLDSELFEFHSERMCEIILEDTGTNTDPHSQLISYNVLLWYGKRKPEFFRSHRRWEPLLPLLMDHILVDIDPEVEDIYTGIAGQSIPIPIEAKLRRVTVKLLYEVCRMQNFSLLDLRLFDDEFIDQLFDLVEQTRNMQDDTFNYSVIKLIVSLNEQFMVASLPSDSHQADLSPEKTNRILRVLMHRLGFSKTFGENLIFMLNRARRTQEDLCMQLLILKMLYLIFTTKGTSEYFYTNDLCVLVDVFIRELVDLDEESESLRHNYLRVLHPLLTKTQLRDYPYKRPQILYTLESLVSQSNFREVNPTTKRLVERCLTGDWCVQLRTREEEEYAGHASDHNGTFSNMASPEQHVTAFKVERSNSRVKTLRSSKSVENMKVQHGEPRPPIPSLEKLRRASNSSSSSLPSVADSKLVSSLPRRRGTAESTIVCGAQAQKHQDRTSSRCGPEHDFHNHHHQLIVPVEQLQSAPCTGILPSPPLFQTRVASPLLSTPSPTSTTSSISDQPQIQTRRRPPPAPPKRRKPPAVPSETTNDSATITVIRSPGVVGTPVVKAVTSKSTSFLQQSAII